ncbi:hypothetical protein BDV96DRAFT_583786, partial [Lophiotrema nucula]
MVILLLTLGALDRAYTKWIHKWNNEVSSLQSADRLQRYRDSVCALSPSRITVLSIGGFYNTDIDSVTSPSPFEIARLM